MGKFHHIEQLAEVKGIGMKMVERLETQIKVEE
jgi:DNA uptake protein ComE-like DNA-binding protein